MIHDSYKIENFIENCSAHKDIFLFHQEKMPNGETYSFYNFAGSKVFFTVWLDPLLDMMEIWFWYTTSEEKNWRSVDRGSKTISFDDVLERINNECKDFIFYNIDIFKSAGRSQ